MWKPWGEAVSHERGITHIWSLLKQKYVHFDFYGSCKHGALNSGDFENMS